ncbi:BTB domain-containing protein [Mycena sanguinolenta]|uniref:BTB domain-containing protein n=1 Tax=Mycena sanguinolenta TaxID=230812 RepID=A0A8H6YHY0_9AGAR|nr:BTB domain-containing protein [Mycena sanguinolenta]
MSTMVSPAVSAGYHHYNDYYYPSGDSIIRVENTLFKIHKFPLVHNSAVFASMFELPSGDGNPEGLSDELPIVLEGETAEDFRAVVKYIYAPPIQVQIQSIPAAALPEMISVARFSHKYAMDHWRSWALKVIGLHVTNLDLLPKEYLQPLYSLFILLEVGPSTRARILKRWCDMVEKNNLSIIPVLAAADAGEDREGLVAVYCIEIRRWEKGASTSAQTLTRNGVSQIHFQRMHSGHTSLTLAWNRFRTHEPPAMFQGTHCAGGGSAEYHTTRCIPYSRTQWVEAIVDAERVYPHVTQIASRLSHVGKRLQKNNMDASTLKMATCFDAVIKRFNYHVQEPDTSLENHFFPCELDSTESLRRKQSVRFSRTLEVQLVPSTGH